MKPLVRASGRLAQAAPARRAARGAHGAAASDAFHLVIPSLPGYGYSGKPREAGWDPARIARAWVVLMKRLDYPRFVSQGGDWGGAITNVMGQQRTSSWPSCMRGGAPTQP